MNREEWLLKMLCSLRPLFEQKGGKVPEKIRVTCGWPSKGAFSQKSRSVGECWFSPASADGHVEIFISPCVSDSQEAGAILAHELVHACDNKGHGAPFKRLATSIGLEGRMTATTAGNALKDRLNAIIMELGQYPHAVLDKTQSPIKKDGTRMIKIVCTAPDCGYTARTTQKWIDVGFPTCPCGSPMGMAE